MTTTKLFHVTTQKKARLYQQTGYIKSPVRGFDTLNAAMFWAMKTGRTVIYEFYSSNPQKLPDHHNQFGYAYWNEGDILYKDINCVVSANNSK